MSEWLDELFHADEVELIKKIPLSLNRLEDKLVWHFDKFGVYSVKSGYKVAREFLRDQLQGSVSAAGTGHDQLWHKIWQVRVLPKIKSFVWRLARGIVPTRAALSRKVELEDVNCPLCSQEVETDLHLFKNCSVAAGFWLASPLGLYARRHGALTLQDWLRDMLNILNHDQAAMFLVLLWSLWLERNNVMWNNKDFSPVSTIQAAVKLLGEYRNCQNIRVRGRKKKNQKKWEFPPRGRLKFNFEGLVDEVGGGAAGMIVRNAEGEVIASWSKKVHNVNSLVHIQAYACRLGLEAARHFGWSEMILESTCLGLVSSIMQQGHELIEVRSLIEDCRAIMQTLNTGRIAHVERKANGAVTRLARLANFGRTVDLVVSVVPDFLTDVLYEDICNAKNVMRGRGFMSPSAHSSINNNGNDA